MALLVASLAFAAFGWALGACFIDSAREAKEMARRAMLRKIRRAMRAPAELNRIGKLLGSLGISMAQASAAAYRMAAVVRELEESESKRRSTSLHATGPAMDIPEGPLTQSLKEMFSWRQQ